MSLTTSLKEISVVRAIHQRFQESTHGVGWGAFHEDREYRRLMLTLAELPSVSSFVDTGTFRGYSTALMADDFPNLNIHSIKIVESTYLKAKKSLRRYPNVSLYLGSSDQRIGDLLRTDAVGKFPLFYLDAHWRTYWPLRDELTAIARDGRSSIIVIDDFHVLKSPQFGFDSYVEATGDVRYCNIEYIGSALGSGNAYSALAPTYSREMAFAGRRGELRGHLVLFQNAEEIFDKFIESPIVISCYREVAIEAINSSIDWV